MGYLLPFGRSIKLGQPFGSNPGLGPNPSGGHNGDDWLTAVGVPVRAAGDGVVVFAGQFDTTYADNFGWNLNYGGLMVVLNMDGGTAPYFEYGHLSRILVANNQRVKRGQIIAITGNSDGGTGVSTGPHCHVGCLPWNFNLNTNTYGRVNPRLYMTDYWEDEASGASLGPAGEITETTEPQEDTLSAAEVKQINDHTTLMLNQLALGGQLGGRTRGGLADVADKVDDVWAWLRAGESGKRVAGPIPAMLAVIQGQNAGLLEALKQATLAPGSALDLEAVKEASKAGATEALADLEATATTTVTLSQEGN